MTIQRISETLVRVVDGDGRIYKISATIDYTDEQILSLYNEILFKEENPPPPTNTQLKSETRGIINQQVGDPLDQLANTDKQLKLILPVVVRLYELVKNLYSNLGIDIPESILPADKKSGYDSYTAAYLQAISTGEYVDRIDVEPDISGTIQRLMAADVKIAQIVKTEYLDKKS